MTRDSSSLARLGWNAFFSEAFGTLDDHTLEPARVCVEYNHLYRVRAGADEPERLARAAGNLKHSARGKAALPGVGDWVAVRKHDEEPAVIRAVLPRRTCFSRKAAGNVTAEQVIAANVDTVLIVSSLDGDFNVKRIQRYLVAAAASGATPVIVLNKADLCESVDRSVSKLRVIAPAVTIHVTSCATDVGLDAVATYKRAGQTMALLGSSGVGKSTIINHLLGFDRQRTRTVRKRDSRGRHTTVHRELFVHPDGGVIIDTPGMRELRLWDEHRAIETVFDDVEQLAADCRFRDCEHRSEPRCAVQHAVVNGGLPADRLAHYHQLQDERARPGQRRGRNDGTGRTPTREQLQPTPTRELRKGE